MKSDFSRTATKLAIGLIVATTLVGGAAAISQVPASQVPASQPAKSATPPAKPAKPANASPSTTKAATETAASSAPARNPAPASGDFIADRSGGIIGTKHDFSHDGRVPRDLCLPCHTPHITAAQAPLLVERGTIHKQTRAYGTRAGELTAASLICLSCHDGSVARDVYAGTHAANWSDRSAGSVAAGSPRVVNHPVGIAYPDGKKGYASAAEVSGIGGLPLPGGRIQCTTCHDPHNTKRFPGMLVTTNERSRLCLTCHKL